MIYHSLIIFLNIDLKFLKLIIAMSSVIYINLSLVILSFNKLLNNYKFLYLNFFIVLVHFDYL